MKKIIIKEKEIELVFFVSSEGKTALVHCGSGGFTGDEPGESEMALLSPVEIASADSGFGSHHGAKKLCGAFSRALVYKGLEDGQTDEGRLVRLLLESERAKVTCCYLFVCGRHGVVLRTWSEVTAKQPFALEYVSAFRFAGLFPPFKEEAYDRIKAYIPHNTWHGEGQWRCSSLSELGLNGCHSGGVNLKRIVYSNTGSWSSKEYLPAGILSSGEKYILWQIESNASWTAEIGQTNMRPYLALSGPSFLENMWQKKLAAGETFTTPYAALTFGGELNSCIAALTDYRRHFAAAYIGDRDLPSQYNGYMHANWDFPTTKSLLAQLEACKKIGIETFVVDAGWFSRGCFWSKLGDWLHPEEPFEGKNFKELIDVCHEKGMKAGLWMELEDIGVECPIAAEAEALLMRRDGIKVCDNDRYFFDFSLKETQEYMDNIVDSVESKYGVEYIKLDYNCDCGIGCDSPDGTFGEGLAAHARGFSEWLARWHARRPELVIEGCASGGMRLDHCSLSAFALGNTSDQICYDRTPYIACNLAAYLVPERMGVWAYPLASQSENEINMNLVNAMLFRLQLSGEIHKLDERRLALVKAGVEYYNSLKEFKRTAVPYLPMGFSTFFDTTVAFGLRGENRVLLAVYNLGGDMRKRIPLTGLRPLCVKTAFPLGSDCRGLLEGELLTVEFRARKEAAIFEIEMKN